MKNPASILAALAFAGVCVAQSPSPPPSHGFVAMVTDAKTKKVSPVHVARFAGNQIHLAAGSGTVAMPVDTISAAEFELPPSVRAASEAYRAGEIEKALALYPALEPYREFVAMPACNVSAEFLNFADSYRQARKYDQAEALLDTLNFGMDRNARFRATLIRAFIACDKKQPQKAEELMKDFPRTVSDDPNFSLDRIVRTRIFLAKDKYHEAALEASEAVAVTRIEAPVYPEALYLAAACYEKMGEVLAKQKSKSTQSDSEKLIDDSINYSEVSQAVRQELTLLFSKSYWARQKPATVEHLLAAADAIALNEKPEIPETTANGGTQQAASEAGKKEEKPVWDTFLNKTVTETKNDDL